MEEIGAQDPHLAGQRIDRDFGAGGAVGEVEERTPFRLQTIPTNFRRLVIAGVPTAARAPRRHALASSPKLIEMLPANTRPSRNSIASGAIFQALAAKAVILSLISPRRDLCRHAVKVCPGRCGGRRSVGNLCGVGCGDAHEMKRHAELFGDDLGDLGEQPLPHLRAAVIEMDRAVGIDMHQRAGLIERDQCERDAKHHRRQRDASLDDRARSVEGGDPLAAGAVVARDLEFLDDRPLRVVILDCLLIRSAFPRPLATDWPCARRADQFRARARSHPSPARLRSCLAGRRSRERRCWRPCWS